MLAEEIPSWAWDKWRLFLANEPADSRQMDLRFGCLLSLLAAQNGVQRSPEDWFASTKRPAEPMDEQAFEALRILLRSQASVVIENGEAKRQRR